MTPNIQERATINFYTWEARARGYILSDSPVEIEPPYIPFIPVQTSSSDIYDDGKIASPLKQAFKFLTQSSKKKEEEPNQDITPQIVTRNDARVVYSLFFPHNTEIQSDLIQEVLHLLCYSEDAFSFKILAQQGSIQILFTASKDDSFRLESQLKAYFPNVILRSIEWDDIHFDFEKPIAIADFGLENEFMLPT